MRLGRGMYVCAFGLSSNIDRINIKGDCFKEVEMRQWTPIELNETY